MKKKDLIDIIARRLKENRGKEIIIKEFSALRNGRHSHPYTITYEENAIHDGVVVRPWSGAPECLCWLARLDRLTKAELLDLAAKIQPENN